ncbi:hypothetical protein [Corynebacterium kroppenstedtii]
MATLAVYSMRNPALIYLSDRLVRALTIQAASGSSSGAEYIADSAI